MNQISKYLGFLAFIFTGLYSLSALAYSPAEMTKILIQTNFVKPTLANANLTIYLDLATTGKVIMNNNTLEPIEKMKKMSELMNVIYRRINNQSYSNLPLLDIFLYDISVNLSEISKTLETCQARQNFDVSSQNKINKKIIIIQNEIQLAISETKKYETK